LGFTIAFLIWIAGTACLMYLDREKGIRVSRALWLPVLWLWIIGSRPLSAWMSIWFGIGPGGAMQMGQATLDAQLDGSPMDAAFFLLLLVAGIAVLFKRKPRTMALLKANGPILLYFSYTMLSCLWSPFPDVALKRWIKDLGELAMVLIIVTEAEPLAAMRRVFSRVGVILFSASILLIRYSWWGRGFEPGGDPMNTGVTTNKNTLGLTIFTIALGVVWSLLHALRAKHQPERTRQIVARAAMMLLALVVLGMAHSATSIACLMLGTMLIVLTQLPFIRGFPSRVHGLMCLLLLCGAVAMIFGGSAGVAGALGRDATFTGRTEIWAAVIPLCPNPLIGAGFESFWNSFGRDVPGLSEVQRGLNSAHDGYIEVYLNLGVLGVSLIVLLLGSGYRKACASFRNSSEIGGLALAYVATSLIYSVTEAGFRIMTPTWFLLLLSVVSAHGATAGLLGSAAPTPTAVRVRRPRLWVDSEEPDLPAIPGDR